MSGFFKDIEREGRRLDRQVGLRPPRTDVAIPEEPEPIDPVAVIGESAEVARRREKRKLLFRGRRTTILSGITSALKKRLGE